MENRTAAVIITIVVVFLCACPGLLFLCNGLFALIEIITNYNVQIIGYGYNAPYWLVASLCIGLLGIIIAIIVAILVLRRPKMPPQRPPSPTPPPPPEEPLPPAI
jgi:hypothetical protein